MKFPHGDRAVNMEDCFVTAHFDISLKHEMFKIKVVFDLPVSFSTTLYTHTHGFLTELNICSLEWIKCIEHFIQSGLIFTSFYCVKL